MMRVKDTIATTADTAQRELEEFDNRVREILKRAELDKKRAKKRAKPTPKAETKKVVVEQKDHAPANEAQKEILTGRALLPFVINALAKKELVPGAPKSDEAIRFVLSTITPEQLEKMQSALTPMQIGCLNKALELSRKMRLDELLESFWKAKLGEALEVFRKTGKFAL
jgi:hypothetical protein